MKKTQLVPAESVSREVINGRVGKIEFTGFAKLCPGKRHAWYETNLGYPVRKELGKVKV